MKFSIETKALADALRVVSVAVTGASFLPILSHVKIEAKDGKTILSATNLDLYITQSANAEVIRDGAVSAPLGLLLQLIDRIGTVRVELEATDSLIVRGGDTLADIETLPADEFPPALEKEGVSATACDASQLLEPFRMLAHAIGTDATRYTLMGISVAPCEDGTEFAASGGARLAVYKSDACLTNSAVIVPDIFVKALLKLKPSGSATVAISDAITLATEETRITAKLIEGSYPNYRQIIPKANGKAFACRRKDLISAINTCALFTERELPGLHIAGRGKQVEVAKPPKARALVLGTELAGQPDITMRFHARHMLDALNVMTGEDVRICCSEPTAPMLIQEGPFKEVLVPITDKTK